MSAPDWMKRKPARRDVRAGIDTTVAHSARVWNYWLGGKDNFAVDREAGELVRQIYPGIVDGARHARAFLGRAVRFLVKEAGLRQLLDIGTGLPTAENTHEIAQRVAPDCRIVYVDNDPLVLTHARVLLTSTPEGVTSYVDGDVRDPDKIMQAADGTLDLRRPVGVILMGILGHVDDYDEARVLVKRLMDAVSSGSYLVLSDGTATSEEVVESHRRYNESGAVPYHPRTPEQIARFFEGLDVVEPGVVPSPQWRPGPLGGDLPEVHGYGGVGRKP